MQHDNGTGGVHFFSVRNRSFAFDIHTTACVEVDDVGLSVLREMLSGAREGLDVKYAGVYPKAAVRASQRECRDLLSTKALGAGPIPYRHRRQDALLAVSLHIAHDCNLRCAYCYADAGTFGRKRTVMDHETMIRAIDFTFEHSAQNPSLNIGFFGGEPLLRFPLIREGVRYAREQARKRDKKVSFSMTSNATLLSPAVMEFISREGFSLIFSLDGPQRIHDRMRTNRAGRGTHRRVLANIKEYARRYSPSFTVRGTFTRTTPDFADQVVFLNRQGFKSVSVEPAQLDDEHPHGLSTEADLLRVRLEYDRLAELYVRRFREGRPLHFFHFDYALGRLLQPRPQHTQCGAGAGFIAVAPDGRVFPCFEAVVEEHNCIGHIDTGMDPEKRRTFQRMHADRRRGCRACWLRYHCGGGCHAFNIRYNDDIHEPYRPYCVFAEHRLMLSAWILAEISQSGPEAVERLKRHVLPVRGGIHEPKP